MKYYHFCNDFSLDLDLTSKTLGTSMDPTMLRSVKFFTRKNGRLYTCSYGNNTLINNGDTVTCVLNNHGLEPGVLQYVCEFQIPDSTYPDFYKKIHQFYVSDIELVKGNGEQLEVDVEAMYGTTIDGKFNDLEAGLDEVSEEVDVISAAIVSIQELNTVQDSSINRIEEMLENFDPSGSDAIQRLDTSVNALQSDVSSLNSSVNSLYTQTEENATGLVSVTNTVNDVSARMDDVEVILGRKADTSVLTNYYTKYETYNKDEVDRAIADAAMDGSLPAGIVIDNNYVHTDNNYTTEDKNKVRDFDLSLYPTNSSLSANYATKAELQNVDDNHPTNSSVSNNYVKKNDMSNYLSDYPTNSSVSSNYATKSDIRDLVNIEDVSFWITEEGYITNNDVSNFVTDNYVNENYVSWENLDEAVFNMIDNNYDVHWKINDIVSDSSTISDISTNVKDISTLVSNVSTKLDRDYLTANTINRDFVKNASLNDYVLNSSLSTNYTTKSEFNEVWETFITADQADDTYAKKDDISTFISENDASVYLTDNDVSTFATSNDISTFKPIVFCTQEEYDTLVENNQVDANTVYMLNGDQTGDDYLTPDDVSNFVTTDDISTFITENDVSIYLTKQEGQGLINQAYRDVNLMMGTDLGQITAQGGTVQNYLETYYTSKNDASVYATTSYVDTQIGNIQNILSTI